MFRNLLLSITVLSLSAFVAFADQKDSPESFQNFQEIVVRTTQEAPEGFLYIPKGVKYKLQTKDDGFSKNDEVSLELAGVHFHIYYGQGPSASSLFSIKIKKGKSETNRAIVAEKLYISNVGNLYTESRFGFHYNIKRKFIIVKNKIVEQKQPFYSINMKCNLNEDLTIMSQRCLGGEVIAKIPKGMSIHVLLAEENSNPCPKCQNYLVMTPFGLVGWACTRPGHILYGPPPQIDCLRNIGP